MLFTHPRHLQGRCSWGASIFRRTFKQHIRRGSSCKIRSNFLRQGTITTPMLPACAITLFTIASRLTPDNLVSPCFIFAISYTCFRLTDPTVPSPPFPGAAPANDALPAPASPAFDFGPAVLPAPFSLFLIGDTPAADRSSDAVGGVLISKWKERSGRTVTRAGMGVPGM